MHRHIILFPSISIILLFSNIVRVTSKNIDKVLSRQKRYLVFPEGSTFSAAVCMTVQTGLLPGEIYTIAANWGISYELPNDTKNFKEFLGKPKPVVQRRHRRDLYQKFETIVNSMGYNGRTCILRALCEASRNLKPRGDSLLDEIIRIVFRYPQKYNVISEADEHHLQYNLAVSKGSEHIDECFAIFPCPFSLIDLALGYYSEFGDLPDT